MAWVPEAPLAESPCAPLHMALAPSALRGTSKWTVGDRKLVIPWVFAEHLLCALGRQVCARGDRVDDTVCQKC